MKRTFYGKELSMKKMTRVEHAIKKMTRIEHIINKDDKD